jgi:hypothetical protein
LVSISVLFQVNFSALNSTYEVDTPSCSAKELDQYYKAMNRYRKASKMSTASNLPLTMLKPVMPGTADSSRLDRLEKKSSRASLFSGMSSILEGISNKAQGKGRNSSNFESST